MLTQHNSLLACMLRWLHHLWLLTKWFLVDSFVCRWCLNSSLGDTITSYYQWGCKLALMELEVQIERFPSYSWESLLAFFFLSFFLSISTHTLNVHFAGSFHLAELVLALACLPGCRRLGSWGRVAWGSKISHGTGVRQKSPFRKGQRMPAMRVLTSLGEFYSQPEGL